MRPAQPPAARGHADAAAPHVGGELCPRGPQLRSRPPPPRAVRPHSPLPSPHRQLLKTELGSFFTEYLQVGGLALQRGWLCFPGAPERTGGHLLPTSGRVEHSVPRTPLRRDSVSPSSHHRSSCRSNEAGTPVTSERRVWHAVGLGRFAVRRPPPPERQRRPPDVHVWATSESPSALSPRCQRRQGPSVPGAAHPVWPGGLQSRWTHRDPGLREARGPAQVTQPGRRGAGGPPCPGRAGGQPEALRFPWSRVSCIIKSFTEVRSTHHTPHRLRVYKSLVFSVVAKSRNRRH